MANNLKEIRTKMGMTQDELAAAIGSSKSYISQLEGGKRNISNIQQGTMERLCAALDCTPDDLKRVTEFEYDEDGKLIVENMFFDPHYQKGVVVQIGEDFFLISNIINLDSAKETAKSLRLIRGVYPEECTPAPDRYYIYTYCVPRKGFNIPLGREITEEEFADLKEKYDISDEDISSEFTDTKGEIYGKRHAKAYTSVQISFEGKDINPALVEKELTAKGIEASNGSPFRLNIRVK